MIQIFTKLQRYPSLVKSVRTLCSVKQNNVQEQKEKFEIIYRFPYIRPFSVVNRLKFFQTILTGVTIPCSAALNLLNYVSLETFQVVSAIGLSGCISLYGLGHLTKKFIGLIYYDEERDMVKVAYVDFWGKRKDIEIPASDVVPLAELPVSATDGLYFKFRRYSAEDILKYNLKFGIVVNIEKMKKVL